MRSPFTGGEVITILENRELTYRKEKFSYTANLYKCVDTEELFTNESMDEVNIGQVYNQYRVRYGIPFADEIRDIRSIYGLAATKMSEILGFGENQYRLYENGEMPSEANGKILKSILNYDIFCNIVKNAENQFYAKEFAKICAKLEGAKDRIAEMNKKREVFVCQRSEANGYAPQSYSRLKNIMLYLIERCNDVYNTKMNKLLFYVDFLSYKRRGIAMSGLAYKAIQYGPIPERYNFIYASIDDIYSDIVEFPSGYSGEVLKAAVSPDMSVFSDDDIKILDQVVVAFKRSKANEISEISHKEDAWINNLMKNQYIPFSEAFTLKAL